MLALLCLAVWTYDGAAVYLVSQWTHWEAGEYTHGLPVLAISAYLVWDARHILARKGPRPTFLVLPGVAVASLLLTLASMTDVMVVQPPLLLALIALAVWALLGRNILKALAFPIAFLLLALPLWGGLTLPLKHLTADAAYFFTRGLAIPAFRDGYMIVLPTGILSIEDACSGLKYLLAALTLGALYAHLNYRLLFHKMGVMAVAAVAAIGANIVRVLIVIYIAYSSDMRSPLVDDHLAIGWVVFAVIVGSLMILDAWLSNSHTRVQVVRNGSTVTSVASAFSGSTATRQLGLFVSAALLIVAPQPILDKAKSHGAGAEQRALVVELPAAVAHWPGPRPVDGGWLPRFDGAVSAMGRYTRGDHAIDLYIGRYASQAQGRELINDLNHVCDGESFVCSESGSVSLQGVELLEQTQVLRDGRYRLIWYWYEVAGLHTISRYRGKLYQVWGELTGHPEASVYAVSLSHSGDGDAARGMLREFVGDSGLLSDGWPAGGDRS